MKPVYEGFENYDEMLKAFELPETEAPPPETILFAGYDHGDYEDTIFVLFRDKNNVLYEVNGGTCSCHDLEGQWSPEVVVLSELISRPSLVRDFPKAIEILQSLEY